MAWYDALVFIGYSFCMIQVGRVYGASSAWSKAYYYEMRENAKLRAQLEKQQEK